ncbi:hypothetical protein SKAU_G00304230 [Synaphobranchus kaupii]|uniref:Uncharacterized protein n=1 Tax=Synaphobranchus kaupii TaxID=118154 RepID=A0A9Q1EWB2_SYNKA|nr:hypothetical protein SKAU_G00304230 [Synaphobranchus kaupii]
MGSASLRWRSAVPGGPAAVWGPFPRMTASASAPRGAQNITRDNKLHPQSQPGSFLQPRSRTNCHPKQSPSLTAVPAPPPPLPRQGVGLHAAMHCMGTRVSNKARDIVARLRAAPAAGTRSRRRLAAERGSCASCGFGVCQALEKNTFRSHRARLPANHSARGTEFQVSMKGSRQSEIPISP